MALKGVFDPSWVHVFSFSLLIRQFLLLINISRAVLYTVNTHNIGKTFFLIFLKACEYITATETTSVSQELFIDVLFRKIPGSIPLVLLVVGKIVLRQCLLRLAYNFVTYCCCRSLNQIIYFWKPLLKCDTA